CRGLRERLVTRAAGRAAHLDSTPPGASWMHLVERLRRRPSERNPPTQPRPAAPRPRGGEVGPAVASPDRSADAATTPPLKALSESARSREEPPPGPVEAAG